MQKYLKLMTILLASVFLSSCFLLPTEDEELAPPLRVPTTVEYNTKPAERKSIVVEVRGGGYIAAAKQSNLTFGDTSGRLNQIHVSLGDVVKEGDLIADLIKNELEDQLYIQEINNQKAKINYEKIIRTEGVTNFDREQAALDLDLNNFELERVKRKLAAAEIRSPIDGKITYYTALRHQDWVDQYRVIATIADLDSLQVFCNSSNFSGIPINSKVRVNFFRNEYEGIVVATPLTIPQDADPSLKELIAISVPSYEFTEKDMGGTCSVIYEQQRSDDAIVIDRSAMRTVSGRRFVVILENGLAVERDIETGIMTNSEVEVISGLQEGDLVIQ